MHLIAITEALNYGKINKKNLFSEARDIQKWETIKNVPCYQSIRQELLEETEKFLGQPIPGLPYSLFRLFTETGSRKEYETLYFERRARLNNLAILSLIYNDPQYLRSLEDTIWEICNEYTWCLPAHLQDSGAQRNCTDSLLTKNEGILHQKLRSPQKMLDLFASETGFALAEILSLLEDKLNLEVIYRAREEIWSRIIEPYQSLNPVLWWETSNMNWASVCAGSIGAAAMYLIDDDSVLATILFRILETMESYLSGVGMDGACTEGISYWTYGFGFYVYFASLLKERTAGKIDLFRQEKVKQIALFQQKAYLTENYVVSFSDASVTQNYQPGLAHFLKRVYPEIKIPDSCYQAKFKEDSGRRWAHAIRDLVWIDPQTQYGLPEKLTEYFEDAEWFISRHKVDDKLVCFAAKGGHNDEPHNHNDVGSFILHVNGETFLADLGRTEYTRQYFQEERYQFLCTSSCGHSVPIIDGRYQQAGPNFKAEQVRVKTTATYDCIRLDLAKAYDVSNLKVLSRQLVFEKNQFPRLILEDQFEFENIKSKVVERFITYYQPELIAPGKVELKGLNCVVKLFFEQELFRWKVQRETMITPESTTRDIYLIDLELNPDQLKIIAKVIWEISEIN